jgi:hypothetical protein
MQSNYIQSPEDMQSNYYSMAWSGMYSLLESCKKRNDQIFWKPEKTAARTGAAGRQYQSNINEKDLSILFSISIGIVAVRMHCRVCADVCCHSCRMHDSPQRDCEARGG